MGPALVQYAAAAATHRGRKRPSNEDAYGFSVEHGVYLVCDGMGGAAAGEVASTVARDEAHRILTAREPGLPLSQAAEQAVEAANQAVYSRAQRNARLHGMGTTLVGLLVEGRRACVLNVGDSRCYLLRKGALRQITLDHSLVEEQILLGRMTRPEAQRSPFRNVITRALGTQPRVTPDIFEMETEPGDLFLLCSDGLTRELPDAKIEALLNAEASLEDLCGRLIGAANKSGGNDNITCLLLHAEG